MKRARDPASFSGAARGRCGARGGRAFTVVELLIVLSMLLAVLGLVAPAVMARMAPATATAMASRVEAAALEARTLAQRLGEPVSLEAELGPDGDWLMVAVAPAVPSGSAGDESDSEVRRRIFARLARGFELTDRAPNQAREGEFPTEDAVEAAGGAGLLLAVFFPDGTVSSVGERFLVGPEGVAMRFDVNRWTGVIRLVRHEVNEAERGSEAFEEGDEP